MTDTPPPADPVTGDRYYQTRAVQQCREAIARGKRRLLVVAPTGSGKMRVIARIMQLTASRGRRAGFAAHARELVEQNEATLASLGVPCHVIMSGRDNEYRSAQEAASALLCPVMAKDTLWARVFSKRAQSNRRRQEAPDLDVLLFDEAHLSLARTWTAIARHYQDKILIGFTATPCRSDGRGLGQLYDELIPMASYVELQRYGYLVPLRIIAPSRPDLARLKITAGDYQRGQLEQRMNKKQLIGDVVTTWLQYAPTTDTVVFASGVQHSLALRDQFRQAGVTAEHVDGKTPLEERTEILERVRDGQVRVLCNYGVMTMGVDVPGWKCMICCRPTKSLGLWWQMAGRIQRPFPGHHQALILDHSDNAVAFGFPDEDVDWSLQAEHRVQDSDTQHSRKERVRRCPKCHEVVKGLVCAACGHVFPPPQPKIQPAAPGELRELERRKRNRSMQRQEKQRYWMRMLAWARYSDRKVSAAACRYRDYFGVWPNGLDYAPRNANESRLSAREFWQRFALPQREKDRSLERVFGRAYAAPESAELSSDPFDTL